MCRIMERLVAFKMHVESSLTELEKLATEDYEYTKQQLASNQVSTTTTDTDTTDSTPTPTLE
jgi:hypothetical protein